MPRHIISTPDKRVGDVAFYMQSNVTIDGGSLDIDTHLWNRMKARGFSGSTIVQLFDINGAQLYRRVSGPFGVDGIWFGKSDRWVNEHFDIDPNIGNTTDRVDITLGETPQNKFAEWVKENWRDIVDVIIWIYGKLVENDDDTKDEAGSDGGPYRVTRRQLVARPVLTQPSLLLPVEGQVFIERTPRTVNLAWQPVPGANKYRVEVEYGTSPGTWSYWICTTVDSPTYTFEHVGMNPGRWRVSALNSGGSHQQSPYSPWRYFEFVVPPRLKTPTLVTPSEGQHFSNYPRIVRLAWQPVPHASSYRVEVERTEAAPSGTLWATDELSMVTGTSLEFTFEGELEGRWRVTALDSNGNYQESSPSSWRFFDYRPVPQLLTPILLLPADNQAIFADYSGAVTFSWQPVSGATQYHIDVECLIMNVVTGAFAPGEIRYPLDTEESKFKPKTDTWHRAYAETLAGTSVTLGDINFQIGRWRVTSEDSSGRHQTSLPSDWRTFAYISQGTNPTVSETITTISSPDLYPPPSILRTRYVLGAQGNEVNECREDSEMFEIG